jgi:hypothetical protein
LSQLRFRRSRWVYVAGAVAAAIAAGVAVPLVSSAGGTTATRVAVTAKPLTVPAASAGSVTASALPQTSPSTRVRSRRHVKPFLSPLGAADLKAAKANARAHAAAASRIIQAQPSGPETAGAPLKSFDGLKDSESVCPPFGCEPPDHGVAANEKFLVQMVNTSIAIYDLKKGSAKSKVTLNKFFKVPAPTPGGCDPDGGNLPFLSDPRVFYDPDSGHFIAAALQLENGFGVATDCDPVSRYWVAVSKSDSPLGKWNIYSFDTRNIIESQTAADYTQLGFNSQAIFIGGNQFNVDTEDYVGAWTLAIPKSTAESGGAIASINGFSEYTANDGTADRLLDTVQPVVSLGAGAGGPPGEILIASFNESESSTPPAATESKIVLFDFSNPLGAASTGTCDSGHQCLSEVVLDGLDTYSQPPLADDYPDCTDCLETIDNRISATPVYMHGMVYATHDTAVDNGDDTNANVQWMIVKPVLDQTAIGGCPQCSQITGDTSLVEKGYLTFPGSTDTWFGAIQPDREGNLFLGFEVGSTTSHWSPSSAYITRRATATDWASPFVALSGFNGVAYLGGRWGDYEAVAFDGWNTNNIWFATEYSDTTGDWGTHLDKVKYTSPSQQ